MKKALLLCLCATPLFAFFSACGLFGAGSHVYCESIVFACPGDSIIQKLQALKASGLYNDARSFSDGVGEEANAPYSFYFYDRAHELLINLEIPVHTPKNTDIHVRGIKDFTVSNEWQPFNKDLTDAKKREVMGWFDNTILPALACKRAAVKQ